jgi:hypothetical protein
LGGSLVGRRRTVDSKIAKSSTCRSLYLDVGVLEQE